MTRVKRIFHPIGQGGFYTEQINDKTIVYDCGLWWNERNSKRAENLIKSAFPAKHVIDILFISHFDYDHVSLIPLLIEHYSVKRIVMPLLDANDNQFLSKLFESLETADGQASKNNSISKLLASSGSFDRDNEGIEIIQINTARSDIADTLVLGDTQLNAAESIIPSGRKIKFNDLDGWVWVPHNIDSTTRSLDLFNRLSNIQPALDLAKLKSDSKYFESKRAIIRESYSKLDGNVNENSLFLYSGPDEGVSVKQIHSRIFHGFPLHYSAYHSCHSPWSHWSPACIFTGDGDLKKTNLKDIYKNYWHHVGTIQVPHHGSRHAFKIDAFEHAAYLCPISVGVNNTYGHPALSVISSLLENGTYPMIISEKTDSALINIHDFICY